MSEKQSMTIILTMITSTFYKNSLCQRNPKGFLTWLLPSPTLYHHHNSHIRIYKDFLNYDAKYKETFEHVSIKWKDRFKEIKRCRWFNVHLFTWTLTPLLQPDLRIERSTVCVSVSTSVKSNTSFSFSWR